MNHEGIIKGYELYIDQVRENIFYVMEQAKGKILSKFIKQNHKLSNEQFEIKVAVLI